MIIFTFWRKITINYKNNFNRNINNMINIKIYLIMYLILIKTYIYKISLLIISLNKNNQVN